MNRGDPMDALHAYYARLDHESPAAASFALEGEGRRREIFARAATVLAPALAAAFAYGQSRYNWEVDKRVLIDTVNTAMASRPRLRAGRAA